MRERCPSCHSFISLEAFIQLRSEFVFCRSCGTSHHVPSIFDVALVAGTRRAETRPFVAQVADFQNGPQGNALSNLLPNGKIIKKRLEQPSVNQLDLFGGVQ